MAARFPSPHIGPYGTLRNGIYDLKSFTVAANQDL